MIEDPLAQVPDSVQLGDIVFRKSKVSPHIVEYGVGDTRVRLKRVREGEIEAQLVWHERETLTTAWAWTWTTVLKRM